jgi:hypothetical protein
MNMLSPREMTRAECIVRDQSLADAAADRLTRFTFHFGCALAVIMLLTITLTHGAA